MKQRWWYLLLAVLVVDAGLVSWWYHQWRDRSQDPVIVAASRRYGLDPALVKAVVWRESGFDPRARGKADELGLMQIRPVAASEWAAAERVRGFHPGLLLDPALNTQAGCWYLRKLLRRYGATDQPEVYALADYNAGRTLVLRWSQGAAATNSAAFLSLMEYPGTKAYIQSVLQRREFYRAQFTGFTRPVDGLTNLVKSRP